jgi:hypothetical protein
MPTEFFQMAEVSPSISTQVQNERTTTQRRSGTIDYWRTIMQYGGWTEDTIRSPKAYVIVGLNIASMPIQTVPPLVPLLDGAEVCTFPPAIIVKAPGVTDADALKVWGYDPGRYSPPPCLSFAYGLTQEATAASFRAKLETALEMGIVDIQVNGTVEIITLSYGAPGTFKNGTRLSGWTSGTVWYGGWKLDSQSYRGHFVSISGREGPGMSGGVYNAWELFARVHEDGDPIGNTPLPFHLWLDSTYQDKFPWRVCVCPYQFAIWVDGYDDADVHMPYPRSAFVSMPWVPSGFTGHEVFAFVSTGILGNFRLKLEWDGYTWFDDGPWSGSNFRDMVIPVLRSRGTMVPVPPERITTSQGMLIMDNAYVTARRDPASIFLIHNRLMGKLWNCCVVSDNYGSSTIVGTMLNADWIHVSSQDWYADYTAAPFYLGVQAASVWWRFDNSVTSDLKGGSVALWRHSGVNT